MGGKSMRTVPNIFVVLFLVCGTSAYPQITRPTADQAPPVAGTGHNYIGLQNERLNPASGAINLRIDIPVPPARGLTVPFAFSYDSNAAQHLVGGLGLIDNASYLAQGGWSYVIPMLSEMQNRYQVSNRVIIGADATIDPIVFVPCTSDAMCTGTASALSFNCNLFCYPYMGLNPPSTDPIPTPCTFYDHFNLTDLGGEVHDLGLVSGDSSHDCLDPNGAPIMSPTGTDGIVIGSAGPLTGPPPAVSAVDAAGNFYFFPNNTAHGVHNQVGDNTNLRIFTGFSMLPSFIEDRNGNVVTFTDNGGGAVTVTDTLGRSAISISGFGTSGNTVSTAGLTNPYTLTWDSFSANWFSQGHFVVYVPEIPPTVPATSCAAGSGEVSFNSSGQPVPLQGVTQIQLPNGQSYRFQYDPIFGLLSKMVYPNGAYVRYVWGTNPQSSRVVIPSTTPTASPGSVAVPCEIVFDTPAVVQRFVSYDGQTEAEEQDFTYSTTWSALPYGLKEWSSKQTVAITKDLIRGTSFKTVYTYVPAPAEVRASRFESAGGFSPNSPVEQNVQVFDSNNMLIRKVEKVYGNASTPPEIETMTTDGQVSQLVRCIINIGNFVQLPRCRNASSFPITVGGLPETNIYLGGLVTDEYQYDFGSGTPGSLLRHIHNDYSLFKNPLMPTSSDLVLTNTYLAATADTITYDGNENRVAESDYGYDETNVSAVTASEHDETHYGPGISVVRKNLTSTTAKCFVVLQGVSCADKVNNLTYDETGQLLSNKDPRGNITSFSYQDSFSDTNPAIGTNGYLTKITNPQTNGMAHIQTFSYAYSDVS
jgi:hypothetical protein